MVVRGWWRVGRVDEKACNLPVPYHIRITRIHNTLKQVTVNDGLQPLVPKLNELMMLLCPVCLQLSTTVNAVEADTSVTGHGDRLVKSELSQHSVQ